MNRTDLDDDVRQFIEDYKRDAAQMKQLGVMDAPAVEESAPDISDLMARIAELEAALKPFAFAATDTDVLIADGGDWLYVGKPYVSVGVPLNFVKVHHLRAAKAALKGDKDA